MAEIELILEAKIVEAVKSLYKVEVPKQAIQIQNTRKEFTGDFTVVVFPLLRWSKKSPELTAEMIGDFLLENEIEVDGFNVVKGFLNLELRNGFWPTQFQEIYDNPEFGRSVINNEDPCLVEYSSPNTNKPLHLGHIRNNLLGYIPIHHKYIPVHHL